MPDGLDLSKIKIGDVELVIKDATARQSVLDLINTIYENNLDIVSRINNLNGRLENVESTSYDYINVRSDWNESNSSSYSYILNKPTFKTINNESLVGTGNIVVSGLPQVSASDNGKILMVVNGQWQLVSPSVLYSGNGIPNNNYGNNGDLFLQTD